MKARIRSRPRSGGRSSTSRSSPPATSSPTPRKPLSPGRRGPRRIRPLLHLKSGPAEADRSRSLPLTARPEYLLRVRCARPHRLCDVRRGEVASRGLSAWSGRTRRCPRLKSASEFPENVMGAGDRQGAVADGERHTLGRVAPDVASGEDARAGGLYHAGLALRERPRLRPRGAGAGCRSIRFAR